MHLVPAGVSAQHRCPEPCWYSSGLGCSRAASSSSRWFQRLWSGAWRALEVEDLDTACLRFSWPWQPREPLAFISTGRFINEVEGKYLKAAMSKVHRLGE